MDSNANKSLEERVAEMERVMKETRRDQASLLFICLATLVGITWHNGYRNNSRNLLAIDVHHHHDHPQE